jgi:hypothetical protein
MGSGSALVAAARLGRRYVGYDLDPGYVEIARRRVALEAPAPSAPAPHLDVTLGDDDLRDRVSRDGPSAGRLAEQALNDAGFAVARRDHTIRGTGVAVDFAATDAAGDRWWFDVAGPLTAHRGGLLRMDTVWRTLGRAAAIQRARRGVPYVVLTTALPRSRSDSDKALRAAGPDVLFDVIDLLDGGALERLKRYAKGGDPAPLPGFWPV